MSKKKGKLGNILSKQEFCLIFFFLSLFLFNWPFLNKMDTHPGKMFIYLFWVWGIIILVLFFTSRTSSGDDSKKEQISKKGER